MAIDAFVDEDTAGCVEVQGGEAHAALEEHQRMVHCWRKVEEKLPLRKAVRAPTASFRRMTVASERSISRAAASRAKTPAKVLRRTWWRMSSESGRCR